MGQVANGLQTDAAGFALALYRHWARGDAPVLLSPVSASLALRPLLSGARGDTASGMHRALSGGKLPPGDVTDPDRFLGADGQALRLAMALWLDRHLELDPAFVRAVSEEGRVGRFDVAFAEVEATRQQINRWTEERTNGRIRDLIAPGGLDAETRMVATSALHFRDEWPSPFWVEATLPAPFTRADGTLAEVPMMRDLRSALFARSEDLSILELEYRHGCSLQVFLPDSPSGIERLEERLTPSNLGRWIDSLETSQVDIWLPRFESRAEYQLGGALSAMGMADAFDPERADFSGVGRPTTGGRLFLSGVIHKTFIDVNESGTEAAAATTTRLIMGMRHRPSRPAEFHADHPFLYMIRHGRKGSILLIGRMTGR